MAATVPVLLGLLALIDGGFAGFRAATGRNARIRKRRYYLLAARRGYGVGAAGLGFVALLVATALAVSADPVPRYAELVRAGIRLLQILLPFAALVVLSLLGYWLLPMRESTFVILVGLGPFTLLRPAVVLGATAWSVLGSTDWLVWAGEVTAAVSLLAVEPVVHRRWYRAPA
ncbi:oxidoreductase [Actinophytocola sp.]|uniref:oxidoreductase n=1 Tax=Actinophytocola sp. TaxID=1872138 RepID=UPI002D7F01FE|nr:oxidoreductase [Actinophytocola sp.]HET9143475.1 oxidoreductase [Actinophytocola sp.]